MVKIKPVIKWSGSKRSQSETIISHMPKEIDTYYEPFVGGASVLFQLLHSDIKVNKYVCSDINNDLIRLWNEIKINPSGLLNTYTKLWNDLNYNEDFERKKEYFYSVRKSFNTTRNPHEFLFLSRTCMNGLIRYNSKGDFNTSLHITRKGILPDTLGKIIFDWSNKLNQKDVLFINSNYKDIQSNENDYFYLDPPYANTKGMYYGNLDYSEFWDWLRSQKAGYIFSFDGSRGDIDHTYDVPKDLYSSHTYLTIGRSRFKDLKDQEVQQVRESLYIR